MSERPKIRIVMADALPRPIETAPTDHPYSRRLLLFSGGGWEVGYWSKFRGVWCDTYDYPLAPSHWLPVPPSPNDL